MKKAATVKPGAYVSAMPFPVDGRQRVRGFVLAVRNGIVLLDLPHGRWCPLSTARVMRAPSTE